MLLPATTSLDTNRKPRHRTFGFLVSCLSLYSRFAGIRCDRKDVARRRVIEYDHNYMYEGGISSIAYLIGF